MNNNIQQHTLPNGIRLVYMPWSTPVAHAGVFVASGSRNEDKETQGLAHFIEHTLFKGTAKRSSTQILTRLESVGGELNAYTSREETAVYASFMSAHTFRALDLLNDIVFHSIFPEKELEKEKEVVIDEIDSYLDTPSEQIFDDFEEHLFPNQPFGANILGTPEKVRSFGREDILRFIETNYTPENIVISYVGNISFKTVKSYIERLFVCPATSRNSHLQPAVPFEKFEIKSNKPIHQSHCIIGGTAPAIPSPNRHAMSLLNNYLGGPAMSSVLNIVLREKNGFTYNNESHYTAYSDTGTFEIYIGTEKKNIEKSLRLIRKELDKLRTKPLSGASLRQIQQQYCGQIAIAADSGLNQMISIGKSLLHTGHIMELEEVFKKIEDVTAGQIMELANHHLCYDRLSSLIYLPEEE